MKIKPHQIQQFANQKKRIKSAGNIAKLILYGFWYNGPETGTFYSERFKEYNHLGI